MRVIDPNVYGGLLRNPGIGFIAAPALSNPAHPALTEPLYRFTPDSPEYNHPPSGVSFVSARWAALEPVEGMYDFSAVDQRLAAEGAAGRLCVFRCAPYALGNDDVPAWLRARNPGKPDFPFWQVDPNTGDYAECWARFVRALASHLDGHPFLASVDMALVGAWGEGGGTEFMRMERLRPIIDAYMDGFVKTPLQCLLHDPQSLAYIRQKRRPVGFRVDCLGDLGGFHGKRWSHMLDFYPQNIENFGMGQAWKTAPVVFEACWTMLDWYKNGWDLDYIIEESLKWHISSFNGKGCPVPRAWQDQVADWVRGMGYRFELRRLSLPDSVVRGEALLVKTLWRNSGAAPCYQDFKVAYRFTDSAGRAFIHVSQADLRGFLPGEDHLLAEDLPLPPAAQGYIRLEVGIETGLPGFPALELGTVTGADRYVDAGVLPVLEAR